MKPVYAYIRVSTAKQGEGVSLQEQREAIDRYAEKNALTIVSYFEERETVAKRGRPVFSRMLSLLRQGKATGVVIHKIDRSARNLRDWADLGQLIDEGVDIHFAHESLDLHSRGGRLSADIQAVIAADYIRNLRQETKKGFYGRLKQAIYPLAAPAGYLDQAKGKAKALDPVTAPLVRRAFDLYVRGNWGLVALSKEMRRLGFKTKRGGKMVKNKLSTILNNPFYVGLIRIKRTGEMFRGVHEPLVSKALFDRVHLVLTGKHRLKLVKHDFIFRRLLTCAECRHALIGERQKGHIYYRCHSRECSMTGIREEEVEKGITVGLSPLSLTPEELEEVRTKIHALRDNWDGDRDREIRAVTLELGSLRERLNRLTDAYLDQMVANEPTRSDARASSLKRKHLRIGCGKSGTESIPSPTVSTNSSNS